MPKANNIKVSLEALKRFGEKSDPLLLLYISQEYAHTAPDMPLKKMAELAASSKTMHDLFQPIINEAKLAEPLLKAVVEGNPKQLIELMKDNPELLFKKGQIKDWAGHVFYHVSAYQMMKYLCDDDMFAKVMLLVPEKLTNEKGGQINFKALQKEQSQVLQQGGADLIKLDFDPTNLPDFDRILQHTETYMLPRNQSYPVTFSLIENPDAILYYKDADGKSSWYYANRDARSIELIQPQLQTKEEAVIFSELEKSMDAMESNSARRSTDDEHDIIAKTMQKRLVRGGIQYEHNGKFYRDTHYDFNRHYNAYRKCIRLYSQNKWDECNEVWCKEVGSVQKEVMWLFQRYREKNRPFFPLPDFRSSPFEREVIIQHSGGNSVENIDSLRDVATGFGSSAPIYKGATSGLHLSSVGSPSGANGHACRLDLVAVNRLVEDAKVNVAEFRPEEILSQGRNIRLN